MIRLPNRRQRWLILGVLIVSLAVLKWAITVLRPSDEERVQEAIETYQALGVPTPYPSELRRTFFPNRLNLPTYATKLGDQWFIVDSYNNRILYSPRADIPVDKWQIMDNDLSRPHSIAFDGRFYVVDDTDAHAVRVYIKTKAGFIRHQSFYDVGAKPHRVILDPKTGKFHVLASASQEMVELVPDGDKLKLARRIPLLSIQGLYTRSFRIIDGYVWLLSSNGVISIVDQRDNNYREVERYLVPAELSNMNDLIKVGNRIYLTATMGKLSWCEGEPRITKNEKVLKCFSLSGQIEYVGNPYMISLVGDRLILSIIAGGDSLIQIFLNPDGSISKWSYLIDPHTY